MTFPTSSLPVLQSLSVWGAILCAVVAAAPVGRAEQPPGPSSTAESSTGSPARTEGSVSAPSAPAIAASKPAEPFAFADFSWVPGNAGASERPLSMGPLTGEFRVDTAYHYSFNHPKDDTISGSSEVFRHGEFQLTQLGIGGDFN